MSTTAPTVTVEIDFDTDLSVGFAYYEKVLVDGPFFYPRLQETSGTNAADASGNDGTGTYEGTVTLNQTSGKPVTGETASRYVNFGSGGRVKFLKPPDGITKLTLEAFVYQATLSGSAATKYFIADSNAGDNDWMAFAIQGDGKLRMQSGADWTTTTAPISAATWYHVACVMDIENDTVQFFVNGVELAATWTPALQTTHLVGFQKTGGTFWYWGAVTAGQTAVSRLAEPAMYLDALNASQLVDHYDARATAPFSGYTWTDVTDYLLVNPGLGRRFGRESSLEEVAPMETTYTLVNDDRRFEVDNTASPYYPNVVPGRPTRVRMTQDAVTYDWAFGFIEDFPQDWDPSGQFGRVSIVAHDSLARMNQHTIQKRRFLEQTSGARMQATANVAGIPESMRAIDAGVEDVMEQTIESGSAGDHARKVAQTDRGLLYFDGRGWMVFQDGSYRSLNARATVARGLLGPSGSVDIVTLGAPVFHAPAALIFNEITLRRPGGVDQVAVDATSRSKYGPRSHQDELLLPTDSAIAARASALLADYKDPTLRVEAIRFNPARSPGQWDHALGVQPSDRYTWVFAPQQGSSVTRDVFVEGIADVWSGSEYVATWFLSLFPVVPVVSGSFRGLLALTS